MFTYFTIKSANEALPGVIEKFNNLKKQKNEIIKAEQELQITMSSKSNFEDYITKKQKLNSEMTKFYQLIEELESIGVSLKGLIRDCLIFLQNALMKMFGCVGRMVKLKLNFGMIWILVLTEENQLA